MLATLMAYRRWQQPPTIGATGGCITLSGTSRTIHRRFLFFKKENTKNFYNNNKKKNVPFTLVILPCLAKAFYPLFTVYVTFS